jgi:lipoprotein-anchoring transpeptidase ErfK/SrfK
MSHRLATALHAATIIGLLCSGASAQDCDRFPTSCQGAGVPRYGPPAARPFELAPRPFDLAPRPYYEAPRPYDPAPRPYYEAAPRPYDPAPRPYYEAAPRPYDPSPRPYYEAAPRPYDPAPRPYYEAAPQPYDPAPRPSYEPAQPYESSPLLDRQVLAMYGPVRGEPYPVPGIKLADIDPTYLRTMVSYPTREPAGTIIVDPANHFLYLVQEGGRAMRYGVGVGRQGFGWSGVATVHDKQEWPDWYPPREMLDRQPDLMRQMSQLQSGIGMPGGPRNPLGARALYLWQGNRDTLYRIHGTFEPWTIGKSVSSGCIRMINQDVIDLYERAPAGARVVVLGSRTG